MPLAKLSVKAESKNQTKSVVTTSGGFEMVIDEPETVRAGYQEVNVKIDIETDANQDTLAKWLTVVEERCPVSDNIGNKTPLNLEIK